MSSNRKLPSSLAINEALPQMMAAGKGVFLIRQEVKNPCHVENTTQGLIEAFGEQRVIDMPVSGNCIVPIPEHINHFYGVFRIIPTPIVLLWSVFSSWLVLYYLPVGQSFCG